MALKSLDISPCIIRTPGAILLPIVLPTPNPREIIRTVPQHLTQHPAPTPEHDSLLAVCQHVCTMYIHVRMYQDMSV